MHTLMVCICAMSLFSLCPVCTATAGGTASSTPSVRFIYVDGSISGFSDGKSWPTAFNDLQLALDEARAHSGPVEVQVAGGTYYPSAPAGRIATFLINRNDLVIRGSMHAGRSILSGNIGAPGSAADNCYHVVTFDGVDETVLLEGFDIRDGYADKLPTVNGGGVHINNSCPRLEDCRIRFNHAIQSGGGLYTNGHSSALSIVNCIFALNTANLTGGAIYADNGIVELDKCEIKGNSALSAGGGISSQSSVITISESDLVDNHSQTTGGAVFAQDTELLLQESELESNGATNGGGGVYFSGAHNLVEFEGCHFSRNYSDHSKGGGAWIITSSKENTYISNCTFFDNQSAKSGGALHSDYLTILNCRFRYNQAGEKGGAIWCGKLEMENCELLRNTSLSSTAGGGALYLAGGVLNGQNYVINCTFVKNDSGYKGGGMLMEGLNSIIYNSIFWGNTSSGSSTEDQIHGTPSSIAYCCVQGGWPGVYSPIITDPPEFRDLRGGDLRLEPTSPCIDAGRDSWVSTMEDLDGNDRIIGDAVDIGAYEFQY